MKALKWFVAVAMLAGCGGSVDGSPSKEEGEPALDEDALKAGAPTIAQFDPSKNLAAAFDHAGRAAGGEDTKLLRISGTPTTSHPTTYETARFKWTYSFGTTLKGKPGVVQETYPGWRSKKLYELGLGANADETETDDVMKTSAEDVLTALKHEHVTCPLEYIEFRGELAPFDPSGYVWFWDVRCTKRDIVYDAKTGEKVQDISIP